MSGSERSLAFRGTSDCMLQSMVQRVQIRRYRDVGCCSTGERCPKRTKQVCYASDFELIFWFLCVWKPSTKFSMPLTFISMTFTLSRAALSRVTAKGSKKLSPQGIRESLPEE